MTQDLISRLTPNSSSTDDDDKDVRKLGYSLVGFLLLGVGGWMTIAPIDSAALAPAVVQVEGKRKAIQHLEGGIVSEIFVANGDLVTQGQILLSLDATRDKSELEILRGRLFNTRAKVDRLEAERSGERKVAFSADLQEAAANDVRASGAISSESSLFDVRLADRDGEIAVIESKQKGLEVVRSAKLEVSESLRKEIEDLSDLLAEGYVDKQRLRQLQRSRTSLLGEVADLEVSIGEAQLSALQVSKRFKTDVVDELTASREVLHDLEQQFSTVMDRVERSDIKSPVSGTVLNLKPNTIGAVIVSGKTLVEVVPLSQRLVVEARVSPMDIDRVRVGQDVELRFSVFKDAYMVSGILRKLSADRLVDPDSSIPYYQAEISLVEEDLTLLEGMELVPGMPAEALIKTGKRTMLGYLTSPMKRLFSNSMLED